MTLGVPITIIKDHTVHWVTCHLLNIKNSAASSFLTDTISPARETRADGDPRGAGARPLGKPGALTPPQAGEIAFFKKKAA